MEEIAQGMLDLREARYYGMEQNGSTNRRAPLTSLTAWAQVTRLPQARSTVGWMEI